MDKLERQEQIYHTAARLFFTLGYHGTTMRGIAREVGVEPGLLYHYYKNKNDLLYSIMKKGLQELTDGIDAALKSRTKPDEQMCAALTTHISYVLRRKDEMALATEIRHLESEQKLEIRDMTRAYARKFGLVLARGIKEGVFRPCNITLTVMFLLSYVAPLAVWYRSDGLIKEDEVITFYINNMMRTVCLDTAGLTVSNISQT